jgi:hypothetical protein
LDKQGFLDDHEIGQSEQGVKLRRVFGQAAVAQLLMAEQVLDDVERVLDYRPHLGQRSLDGLRQIPQAFRQCFDDAALMMLRLIAMFQATSRSSSSGRLSTPV